jgi:cytochrome c553
LLKTTLTYALRAAAVFGLGLGMAMLKVEWKRQQHWAVPTETVALGDPNEGAHLMILAKCGVCHGEDYAGGCLMDSPLLGGLCGPNLTTTDLTALELVAAIRYGVHLDGSPLLGMPTREHAAFTDSELGAILSAIRVLPKVEKEVKSSYVGPGFAVLDFFEQIELVGVEWVEERERVEIPVGETAEYGQHLAEIGGCYSCHGKALSGGKIPGAPPDWPMASNLTPTGIGSWSEEDFLKALRTGERPDGQLLDERMPWRYTAKMREVELKALYRFLNTLPPMETGENH